MSARNTTTQIKEIARIISNNICSRCGKYPKDCSRESFDKYECKNFTDTLLLIKETLSNE